LHECLTVKQPLVFTWDFNREETHRVFKWDFNGEATHRDFTWDFYSEVTQRVFTWDFDREFHTSLKKGGGMKEAY